jgi:cellulose synthase/poly-beta-1,6-N-acetylglucosamine synthase-like glycosyltransferase
MTRPAIIVAIPARNEAERIRACLAALASQPAASQRITAVVVHANNCTDATAALARSTALPFALDVVESLLPPPRAHIGHARHIATDAAIAWAQQHGIDDAIIAGTDADSRVAHGWLDALVAAFDGGVDAVCGAIELDGPVPPRLAAGRADEARYAACVAQAAAVLDPLPHDPWPNHIWSWGANFAVRARTLAAVGGTPLVDLAEDRALHAELLRCDARVRHSLAARVITSARADGRAPGGLADLMTSYEADPDALADFALEPARITWRRALLRGHARRCWGDRPGFGADWADRERAMESLPHSRVSLARLPAESAQLASWIKAATDRSGSPARAAPRRFAQQAVTH